MNPYTATRDATTRVINWIGSYSIILALIVPVVLLALLFWWIASLDERQLLTLIFFAIVLKGK
jgi:hypothetical protein